MRVALDATPLVLTSGGLRRYVEELSLALAHEFPGDRFTLLSDQAFQISNPNVPGNLTCGGRPESALEKRWWLAGAALATKRNSAEVFHGTNFEVPLFGLCPSVMTIHDLSPWKNPLWHPQGSRARRRTPWLLRFGVPNAVITPTEAVRRGVMERFGVPPERVFAVPEAASLHFSTRQNSDRAKRPPYFLFAGTIEPRKNLATLLSAWREVKKTCDVRLVLVGRRRPDGPVIEEEPGLELAGEKTDDELANLYSGALAFVYPSFYEGFGLPVLEAMQCGAPVLISRDAALLEVSGGAALTAQSTSEFAEAMLAMATNSDLAAEQRTKSLARAARFSWRRTARMTREVYKEALGRFA